MSGQPLPGVLGTVAPVLDHYGYLAVAGFVFLEDFGIPVPGETVLVAAAVYAGAGRLDVVAVALLAVAAAVLGDNVGFGIGRFGGRSVLLRWGRYVGLTKERFAHAEGWFHDHGGKVVAVARFVEGLRQANGIVAGATGMRWPRFLAFNAVGAVLWVAVWTVVGEVSGRHVATLYHDVSRVALGASVLVVLALVARLVVRRRARRREAVRPGP